MSKQRNQPKPNTSTTHCSHPSRLLDGCEQDDLGKVFPNAAVGTPTRAVSVKVGMMRTAHKTVAMFRRDVHTEGDPVRQAAGLVTSRRQASTGTRRNEPVEAQRHDLRHRTWAWINMPVSGIVRRSR